MSYDLFISYSRQDDRKGRVTELVEHISAEFEAFAGRPINPFFDKNAIQGMDDWRHRILKGLRESHLLLACLSPTYLKSDYCEWEFIEYLKNEIGHAYFGDGVAPVYFIEVPGWEDKGFEQQCAAWVTEMRRRQHFDLRPWFHAGHETLRDSFVKDQMDKLNEKLVERIERYKSAESNLGNVDAHNMHFIGRVGELRRLRETMALGRVGVLTAVHGLGGVGKTALAVEYAHTFAYEYGGGRWQALCEGKEDLRTVVASLRGVRDLDFEFTDDEKLDLDRQFERVIQELKKLADARSPHRCLLILDNVDRPKLLEPAQTKRLPSDDWFHVLATTRLGESELFGRHKDRAFLPVDELPVADAMELIESYQPGGTFRNDAERAAALEIVRLLGCFTLAVELAAVYLGQFANEVTCSGFLLRLKKEGLAGLDDAVTGSGESLLHGEMRLSTTLQPTLERLAEAEKLALGYAALLPADQVALPWIRALVSEQFPEIGNDAEPGYPDPWKNLLRHLLSLRLLQKTDVTDMDGNVLVVRVHRLVQEIVSRQFTQEESAARESAVRRLVEERDAVLQATTTWQNAHWELDPLEALAILRAGQNHPWAAWLLNQVGQGLYHLANWTKAEPLMRQVLEIDEKSLGPRHPNVATDLNNLASLLQDTNRMDEAEPLMRRALEIDKKNIGPNHPKVAIRLNNLAQLLQDTNRMNEAEPLLRRALAIFEKSFGLEHPNVATTLDNLALLLQGTNRMDEAEPLMRRALEIDEKSFGPHHPKVATDLSNLASLLKTANRMDEAEPLMRRALEIYEKSFGPDHPKIAIRLNNLAQLLQDTNRRDEAEPLMRRALEIDEKSFGPHHPSVAIDLNNLAQLLKATNRIDEAEPLMRRALEMDEKSFGPHHPDIARDLNNLAQLLYDTNRMEEAEPLMRRALEIYEKSFGLDHLSVATALNNLAWLLKATNRIDEAEPLMRRTLEIDEKSFGPDHPKVAIRLKNLALLLLDTNRMDEARPLMRRGLSILFQFTRATGHSHPNLQTVIDNYLELLRAMGTSDEDIRAKLKELAPDFSWGQKE